MEGRHRLSRRTTLDLGASRHERRYEENAHLDGPLDDVSAGLGWAIMPTLRLDAAAGWGRQRTERERERHTSRWGRIGATLLLPRGFTVGGAFTLRRTDYPADWFPFVLGGGARRDTTRSIRLSVHNRAFTVAGFGPQLWVAREERKSNAQLHDYRAPVRRAPLRKAVLSHGRDASFDTRPAAATQDEGLVMQRPPDLAERVARIEERMATRDDLAELRALIETRHATARWLRGTLSTAAIAAGFLALLLVFTG